jgi:hypothetical protein
MAQWLEPHSGRIEEALPQRVGVRWKPFNRLTSRSTKCRWRYAPLSNRVRRSRFCRGMTAPMPRLRR